MTDWEEEEEEVEEEEDGTHRARVCLISLGFSSSLDFGTIFATRSFPIYRGLENIGRPVIIGYNQGWRRKGIGGNFSSLEERDGNDRRLKGNLGGTLKLSRETCLELFGSFDILFEDIGNKFGERQLEKIFQGTREARRGRESRIYAKSIACASGVRGRLSRGL